MVGKAVKGLAEAMRGLSLSSQSLRTRATGQNTLSACRRSMATEATVPGITRSVDEQWRPAPHVPVTIYSFPSLEPTSLEAYSRHHLYLPLRRDILHLAVIYEGDKTRQGTASSKTRWEVAGSHRKVRPQKGTGKARAGSRQSPIFRGGGKTFGPKPRDFSTKLNRKVYDLAWRTALSYRYRRGELVVTDDGLELPLPDQFLQLAESNRMGRELEDVFLHDYITSLMGMLEWGKPNGRTTFITGDHRPNLFTGLEIAGEHGRALELDEVDVKDLLETGRLVIERSALKEMIERHQSDLVSRIAVHGALPPAPQVGMVLATVDKS